MRIGLVIYGSLDTLSGGYLYDRTLVEYLRRQGDTVEVVSIPWRRYAWHLADNWSKELQRRLASLPVDILVQDELNHPSLFRLNRRLRGAPEPGRPYPIVSIVHHLLSSEERPSWQNAFYRVVEKAYLGSLDGFVFNSRTTQRVVEGLVGTGRPWVVAMPAGDRLAPTITEEAIRCRALEPGPLRLFFLGNIIPRKGLHTLIDALPRLPRAAWRLTVAGSLEMDPVYAGSIRRQVAALGLGDQVNFLGPLQESDLVGQMQASHVLVVPSSYEGFGIAYLEGMGYGLPAIASTGGAAHEIITHGLDGFLIAPGDAGALAEHLKLMAADRPRLLQMSLAAQRCYRAHPTWDQTGAAIRSFLTGLSLQRK